MKIPVFGLSIFVKSGKNSISAVRVNFFISHSEASSEYQSINGLQFAILTFKIFNQSE